MHIWYTSSMYWIQQPEIVSQPKVGIKSHVINQIYMNSEHQLVSGLLYFLHIEIIKNIQHLSKMFSKISFS